MVKADIIRLIELRLKISHEEASRQVEDILESIKQCFADKESVLISGFGKWKVLHKEERTGRNPKTGKLHTVSARDVVTFYPSGVWRNGLDKKSPAHLPTRRKSANNSTSSSTRPFVS